MIQPFCSRKMCSVSGTSVMVALTLFLLFSARMRAQGTSLPPSQNAQAMGEQGHPMSHHDGHAMDTKRQLDHMTRKLNLTKVEQKKILPILQDQHREIESLRKDSAASRQDIHQQWQSIHRATQQRIRAVLSGPQRQQYDEMIANMHQHMRQYWKQMRQDVARSGD